VADEPMKYSVAAVVTYKEMERAQGHALRWTIARLARDLADKPGVALRSLDPWSFDGEPVGVQIVLTKYPADVAARLLDKHPDRFARHDIP
jgi:hypothetical protein